HHRWTDRVGGIINFVSELELHRDYIFAKIPDKDACNKAGAHVIDGIIPQPFDEQFHNRTCDCEKLRWIWAECGCENKAYQLRAQEDIELCQIYFTNFPVGKGQTNALLHWIISGIYQRPMITLFWLRWMLM